MSLSRFESFWEAGSYLIFTDRTKPAMKWTVEELEKRGKKVFTVDVSSKRGEELEATINNIPSGFEAAVVGVTTMEPAQIVSSALTHGIAKIWLHWRTETEDAIRRCEEAGVEFHFGRCPVMYLSRGVNAHTLHGGFLKLFGRY